MLSMPVSSSRLRKVTPLAVPGRWRWVMRPPTRTRVPCSIRSSDSIEQMSSASSRVRRCSIGWVSGEMRVAQRSAVVISTSLMPGSMGGGACTSVPSSWSVRSA